MTFAFRRSRIASAAVVFLSIVIAVLIWFRDRNHPVIVPILASTLTLGIGFFSSRVLANLLSSMENTRYLGYLHMELDPEKFLEHYRPIPERMKGSDRAICRSYLADAYSAAGKFQEALSTLTQEAPPENLPIQGLYASGLAACYLNLGNLEAAKAQLTRLEEIINACRLDKPQLAQNLEGSLSLHRQHLNCLSAEPVDTRYLEDAFQSAQYNIRRLEIARILAMAALRDGDSESAGKHLSFLRKNAGKTWFKRWADRAA